MPLMDDPISKAREGIRGSSPTFLFVAPVAHSWWYRLAVNPGKSLH
jgi:hypothetical protein